MHGGSSFLPVRRRHAPRSRPRATRFTSPRRMVAMRCAVGVCVWRSGWVGLGEPRADGIVLVVVMAAAGIIQMLPRRSPSDRVRRAPGRGGARINRPIHDAIGADTGLNRVDWVVAQARPGRRAVDKLCPRSIEGTRRPLRSVQKQQQQRRDEERREVVPYWSIQKKKAAPAGLGTPTTDDRRRPPAAAASGSGVSAPEKGGLDARDQLTWGHTASPVKPHSDQRCSQTSEEAGRSRIAVKSGRSRSELLEQAQSEATTNPNAQRRKITTQKERDALKTSYISGSFLSCLFQNPDEISSIEKTLSNDIQLIYMSI